MKGIGNSLVGVKNGKGSDSTPGTPSFSAMWYPPSDFGWYTTVVGWYSRAAVH